MINKGLISFNDWSKSNNQEIEFNCENCGVTPEIIWEIGTKKYPLFSYLCENCYKKMVLNK